MKERAIDRERAIVPHHQASEVSEPGVGAFDNPSPPVASQRSAILRRGPNSISLVRTDQFNPPLLQALAQRIAVIRFVGDHPQRLLPRSARAMTQPYADRRKRRLREFDFRRGCRVKVVSQRKTEAVDHHHPLRPLAPLGFSDSAAPFFAGAKLPSRNDSLHFNCWRSFNSLRNVRQICNQTPRSAASKESLPAHGDSRSTAAPLCVVWAAWGARARFSSTALRSTTDRIAPSALLRRC